jgi:Zn-dependent protease
MRNGLQIARVLGIPIRVHWSWFAILLLITWTLAEGYFPGRLPGAAVRVLWAYGLIAALLLFVSILLHELSHAVVARRAGVTVSGITLHVFGGVAQLEREPDSPRTELLMAAAGPLTSLAVAAACWAALGALRLPPAAEAVVRYLGGVNLLVALFNLVPGFPLDGGRLLRAALWAWRRDVAWATRIASVAGSSFAFLLVAAGTLRLMAGEFVPGAWLVLIGLFLQQAARASYGELIARRSLEPVPVAEAMSRDVIVAPAGASLRHLVDAYFWPHHVGSFPVVADGTPGDGLVGIVTIQHVKAVPAERWTATTVRDVMIPLRDDLTVSASASCWEALRRLTANGVGRLVVRDGGRLVGYISLRDVTHLLALRAAGAALDGQRDRGRAADRGWPRVERVA